ncbi:MAG: ATP-binding protein [Spirosoma sp.]|nr:ATP-binding protein [Spirosoma sp.]
MAQNYTQTYPAEPNPSALIETILAEPRAGAILETFRSIGYSLDMAVADIIDNSISAGAKKIDIYFHWNGPDSWLTIADDGHGMNEAELTEALRPGSHDPLAVRSVNDLGRFGLGLKTASLSQCRRLTLISRRPDQTPAYLCWSIDHVRLTDRWELIRHLTKPQLLAECRQLPGGTIVLWEDLDRLTAGTNADSGADRDRFLQLAQSVKAHLGMTFHRFLEPGTPGQPGLKITINGNPVPAWDPYLHGQSGLQTLPTEKLAGGLVSVKGFILPHISKLSPVAHKDGAGPGGWNAQQGFYIYRNRRLLMAGSWLSLGYKKEEHYKLARIRLDITNQQDADWQIDIRKARAQPPAQLRADLKRIADLVRARAVEIYRHRGKVLQRSLTQVFVPVWQEKVRHNKRQYVINRDHPLIRQTLAGATSAEITTLLRLIEETIPVPLIALSESNQPDTQPVPYDANHADLLGLMRLVYTGLLKTMPDADARRHLLMTEPFNDHPYLLESL